MDTGAYAEFVVEGSKIGFGLTGVWGAQPGVVGPQGDSVGERQRFGLTRLNKGLASAVAIGAFQNLNPSANLYY